MKWAFVTFGQDPLATSPGGERGAWSGQRGAREHRHDTARLQRGKQA